MSTTSIEAELRAAADPSKAVFLSRYFKTGKGEYGEGDVFIGLTVPQVRAIAKKYWQLPYGDVERLLGSHVHEFRLCALEILVLHATNEPEDRKKIFDFYFEHIEAVNNWDLVDGSCRVIVGDYLSDKSRKKLYDLARSKNLWERRIAIVSTYAYIVKHQFADTTAICELLLKDEHDLMHKACGWMLREVYKRSPHVTEAFLRKHAATMPRTMLRYAIEKLPEKKRKEWLAAGKKKAGF